MLGSWKVSKSEGPAYIMLGYQVVLGVLSFEESIPFLISTQNFPCCGKNLKLYLIQIPLNLKLVVWKIYTRQHIWFIRLCYIVQWIYIYVHIIYIRNQPTDHSGNELVDFKLLPGSDNGDSEARKAFTIRCRVGGIWLLIAEVIHTVWIAPYHFVRIHCKINSSICNYTKIKNVLLCQSILKGVTHYYQLCICRGRMS